MSEHEHYHHHEGDHHHHHEDGNNDHHNQHEHHHQQHDHDHNEDHQHHSSESSGNGSSNDNGYVVVPPTPQSSVDNQVSSSTVDKVLDLLSSSPDEIQRMLADIGSSAEAKLSNVTETVRAEADSSSSVSVEKPASKKEDSKSAPNKKEAASSSSGSTCSPNASFFCPYYLMAMDRLTKIEVPPKVKELLLWKNPKLTGAIFGSAFLLLISIAWFSLLTVVSAIFLTALTLIGSYRFYLALIFRIKGTYDNTFDKLSSQDISLPKDKVQNLAHLLETDFNRILNQLKSILLWDNITTSGLAFIGFYVVYCIGCMFNTVTLLILALVSAFTLPKVYEVYKKPIDQGIEKATSVVHQTVKQIMTKVPMLNKKKTQ